MKLLSLFLPAALASNDATPAEESEFSILHCNNPTTMRAEMKVKVQARFLTRNGGLEASWADGFTEEDTGVFTKIIEANDLVLSEKDGDTDSEFETTIWKINLQNLKKIIILRLLLGSSNKNGSKDCGRFHDRWYGQKY